MEQPIKYIHFHNNTELAVIIDSWIDGSSMLFSQKIEPREKCIVHSSVGEWHIHSMHNTIEDVRAWKNSGLNHMYTIGKFRSEPCYSGNYSWLDYCKPFECFYTKLETPENDIMGLITFQRIPV